MAVYVRAKRVTDPLNDGVKANLCCWDCRKTGYESSSKEQADSPCLADLVHGFIEEDAPGILLPERTLDSWQVEFPVKEVLDMLNELANANVKDGLKCHLRSLVSQAVETLAGVLSSRAVFRQAVMKLLRDSGYNAGICKSEWGSSSGLTAGNYEYIDVVITEGSRETRYLVDVDFAGEFEIARPTKQYSQILLTLPRVFVGKAEELKQMIAVVCEAGKKSLQAKALHLPPWRKNRYMQAKWLGPYKRTVNLPPTAGKMFSPESVVVTAVRCRRVGFEACAVNMDLM